MDVRVLNLMASSNGESCVFPHLELLFGSILPPFQLFMVLGLMFRRRPPRNEQLKTLTSHIETVCTLAQIYSIELMAQRRL